MKKLLLALFVCCATAMAQNGPVIFYTDLISGPNSGGENSGGVYVSIYGNYFGASQGSSSVTLGAVKATVYKIWSNTKIAFQVPSSAPSGLQDIQVDIPGTGNSNESPFTVRTGNIYCVSSSGADTNSGLLSAGACWATTQHGIDGMSPGDTTYFENGYTDTSCGTWNAAGAIYNSGTPGKPMALVAYPGATVTIGNMSCQYALFVPGIASGDVPAPFAHWVIAGFNLQARDGVFDAEAGDSTDYRFIANNMTAPHASDEDSCFETSGTDNSYFEFLGNTVHDCEVYDSSKLGHGVYFSTDSNHDDVGWNTIYNINGCRGIQFNSSPTVSGVPVDGFEQYDISVHDNVIHDTTCDGINLASVDPTYGAVKVYNNVIYNAGEGPDPSDGLSDYGCIYVANEPNQVSPFYGGVIYVYNNTFYNCGNRENNYTQGMGGAGGINIQQWLPSYGGGVIFGQNQVDAVNNLILQNSGEPYLSASSYAPYLFGSNNVWYGNGAAPTQTTGNLTSDPLMNFELNPFPAASPTLTATSGGSVAPISASGSLSESGTTATFTISNGQLPNSFFLTGNLVYISGATVSGYNTSSPVTAANITYTSFTYTAGASGLSAATGTASYAQGFLVEAAYVSGGAAQAPSARWGVQTDSSCAASGNCSFTVTSPPAATGVTQYAVFAGEPSPLVQQGSFINIGTNASITSFSSSGGALPVPDFHLQAASPALHAGTTPPFPDPYDIAGNPRSSTTPSIGAYEK